MRPTDPRLRRQLVPARRQLLGVVGGGVVGALLVIGQAWAITGLVVAVVRGEDLTTWLVAVPLVLAARALTGWSVDALAARAAALVGADLRRRVVRAALQERGRPTTAPAPSTGEVAVLATRGVAAAEPYLTRYVPALVLAGVLPLLTLGVVALADPLSAVIIAATLPLVPVFGALVGLATRDRAETQWRAMASLSGHFLDVVRGLPTLVAFRRARAQSAVVAEMTDRYRRASIGTLRLAFASSAVLELVATLSVALVAVTVGVRLADGGLDLRTALLVLLLAPEAYWPLRRVGAEFHAAAEGVATFEAVSASTAAADARDGDDATSTRLPGVGALVVSDLCVTYPGRTTPALAHLDATVPDRGVTVVVGPSGAGKSTLLAALAGLAPVTGGAVLRQGRPVGGAAWRTGVAWLPQRPVFVAGTLADNLRLGRPDAGVGDLWSALRRVALEERVRTLPAGLETTLGEDGSSLSAGERARLALARVLVADRPWVLLDEPTAHLDPLTEQVIADTIVELGRSRAVVVVAHRPALVALADHVVEVPAADAAVPPAATAPSPGHRVARPVTASSAQPADPGSTGLLASTLVGALASASGVALTATAGWLIVQASTRPPVLTLLVAIVGVRTFGLARPVLRYVERLTSHDRALRLLARRRVEVYDALVPLVPGRIGRRRGEVLSSIVDDVDSTVDRELRVRMPVRQLALVGLLATLVAAVLTPAAGLVVGGGTALAAALAWGVARVGSGRAERSSVTARSALSATVVEVVQCAPELVVWQAEPAALDRVDTAGRELGRATTRAGAWLGLARGLVLVLGGASVALSAAVVAPAVRSGDLSGPMAALLVLLPLALLDVTLPVADAGALAARTAAAEARLRTLASTPPAVRDTFAPASATPLYSLHVEGVDAGWGARPVLRRLDLEVPAGGRLGVTGGSGSGKSTLAALLLRFLDPQAGRVRLGGTSTSLMPLDDVRRTVGLVDDDPHVFASTLVENVRLARPAADDAEVEDALRQARLGPWLDALPEGLHTWLGDGHAQVSGGERARLALARSFLAEQPVLVLDEPTAHLDHATATLLAQEVLGRRDGRTVVWISHDRVGLDLVDEVVDLTPDPLGRDLRPAGGGPATVAPEV